MVPTSLEKLAAAVTVITGEEITKYNYDRIEDVFRQVPGVQVQTSGSPGKATSLSIRGGGSQRALVLVDGMRTNSPTSGSTDIAEFTIDAIDRIEIVRGPQSTLYGADAITGVVNIITKKGQGTAERQRVGGGRQLQDLPRAGERPGRVRRLQLERHGEPVQHGGQSPARRQQPDRACLGPARVRLSLGRRARADRPLLEPQPGAADLLDRRRPSSIRTPRTSSRRDSTSSPTRRRSSTGGPSRAASGSGSTARTSENQPPPGSATSTRSQINTSRVQADVLSTFTIPKWNTLTLGWEYRSESGTGNTQGTFPSVLLPDAQHAGVLRAGRADALRPTRCSAAGSGGRTITSSAPRSPGRASAALLIKEIGTKLRFAWGQGFRAPTINDLFFPGLLPIPIFSRNEARAGRSESISGCGRTASVSAPRISTSSSPNLIQFVFDPTTFLFLPQNVGRARIQGAEAYAAFDPVPVDRLLRQLHVPRCQGPRHEPGGSAGAAQHGEHRGDGDAVEPPLALHAGQRRVEPARVRVRRDAIRATTGSTRAGPSSSWASRDG